MGQVFESLSDTHIEFIGRQKIFFVATAPNSSSGSVNISPKGYDSLNVIGANEVEWVDLGGSGVETIAHLRENGRITLMFCAFEGAAHILRLYGSGDVICFDDLAFPEAFERFPKFDRARSIIRVKISRIADSCGWGVPFFDFREEREQLRRWVVDRPIDEWKEKRYVSNSRSIDGLPGLDRPKGPSRN